LQQKHKRVTHSVKACLRKWQKNIKEVDYVLKMKVIEALSPTLTSAQNNGRKNTKQDKFSIFKQTG